METKALLGHVTAARAPSTDVVTDPDDNGNSGVMVHNLPDLHIYLTRNSGKYWIARGGGIFRRNLFARSAVFYPFMLEGIFMGVWSSYLPNIQDNLKLSDSELGLAVLCVYLATVMATPLAAYTIRNLGSKYSTLLGAATFSLSLPFISFARSLVVLVIAMFMFGGTMGLMDVSMNSCAVLTEIVAAKPLMGSFHGSYSVAAAIGSLMGGAFVEQHYSTSLVFLLLSGAATILSAGNSFNMYSHAQEKVINAFNDEQDRLDLSEQLLKDKENSRASLNNYASIKNDVETADVNGVTDTLLNEPSHKSADDDQVVAAGKHSIIFFCAVGFLAAFGESGIVTWSTVFFDRYLPTTSVTRSLGFTCFMVSMAVGRFCCDYLRRVFGRRLVVKVGGLLASSGLLLVVLCVYLPASMVFACLGFAFAGLGLSTLIPTMFSSAGHIPGLPADATIATVAGFSYSGSIVSSPLIGFLSDLFGSLRMALLAASVIIGMIFIFGHGIPAEFGVLATNHHDSVDVHTKLGDKSTVTIDSRQVYDDGSINTVDSKNS
jgi:MFS family permease